MIQATLIRLVTGDLGTFGAILFPSGFALHTLELPWEKNERDISCIPCQTYVCEVDDSPKWGSAYHVRDVEGRSHILFHRGNWAGRKSMSELQSNVAGCILVGHERKHIAGANEDEPQLGVSESRKACDDMMAHLAGEPFELLVMSRVDDEAFEAERPSG